jgi:peptidyl-tRNA hydrolase
MARLPSAQDINRQIPTVERPVVNLPVDTTGRSLQQAGSALAQVGSKLQAQSARLQYYEEQVLEQERNKEIKLQQAFAQTGHLQDLNEWRANSQNDTDYATLPDRFEQFANEALQRRSAGIMDNDVKTLFELSAKQNISNYKLKIRENAYTIRNQQLVAGFEDSFAKTTNQISATDDPSQIDALVKSQIQQLDGLIAIGAIPASKRPEAIRTIQNTVSYSKFDKMPAEQVIDTFNNGSGVDFTTTGNQALDEVHKKVAAQTGTPYEFLTRNAQIESNGNPNAKNPESSAAGAQQITKGTAKSLGINPYDINQAALGTAQLYNEHKQRFTKEMGREPTDAELSAMHWLGSGDSMALFRAYDTDEKAFDILTRKKDASQARDIILNHRGNLDMTAAELLNIRINKYNGTENKELLKYLTPAQQKQLQTKAKSQIRTNIAQEFDNVQKATQGGAVIPMETFDKLANQALLMEDAQLANTIKTYGNNQNNMAIFATLSFEEQVSQLSRLQAELDAGNNQNGALYSGLKTIYDNKMQAIQTNPTDYYARIGVATPVAPIDFSAQDLDIGMLQQQMQVRRENVDAITKYEKGLVDVAILSGDEIKAIKTDFDKGDPITFANKMQTLKSTLSPTEQAKVAYEAGKADSILGAVIASEPEVAARLMQGKNIKLPIQYKTLKDDFLAEIKDMKIAGDRATPMFEAVKSYYNFLHAQRDISDNAVDSDDLSTAIADVLGKPVEINNSKIFSFKVGDTMLEEDVFQNMVDLLDDQTILSTHGELPIFNGKERSINNYRNDVTFATAGDGKYFLYVGSVPFVNSQQEPFILDLKKIMVSK